MIPMQLTGHPLPMPSKLPEVVWTDGLLEMDHHGKFWPLGCDERDLGSCQVLAAPPEIKLCEISQVIF